MSRTTRMLLVYSLQLCERTGMPGKTVAILGMLDDKDVEGVVAHLADEVDHWIAVTADSQRAFSADELGRRVANASNTPASSLTPSSLLWIAHRN